MSVLSDKKIVESISSESPLATNVDSSDTGKRSSKIQPSSLDLTIGKIYLPGKPRNTLGGICNPYTQSYALAQGRTAVVVTNECLTIPNDIAAVGFPPSFVSLRGLLMTNPGHVDPGYRGHMTFTVINMGHKPYDLRVGAPIVTLVLMKLIDGATTPYDRLQPIRTGSASPVNEEVLDRLSEDFLDIEDRAKQIASQSVLKAQWGPPLISAALAAVATFVISIWQPWQSSIQTANDRILKLESRFGAFGADLDLDSIEDRLNNIEARLPPP